MGKSSDAARQEVTQYNASIHFGICSGPVDYISQIIVNEKVAWSGEQSVQGSITISDKMELFGGVKKEGGVQGIVEFLPGDDAQTIPELLAGKVGLTPATMPAYRGIASAWFYGRNLVEPEDEGLGFYWTANSPYLPGVWIKVARASTNLNEEHARIYRLGVGTDDWAQGEDATVTWWQRCFTGGGGEAGSDDRARMGIEFLDSGGSSLGAVDWSSYTSHTEWTQRSHTVEIPAGAISIKLHMGMDRESGVFADGFIDDITLTVAGIEQAVLNPGAELGWTVGNPPPSWLGVFLAWNNSDGKGTAHGGEWFFGGTEYASSGLIYQIITITIGGEFDSNPAHIIYETLTNTDWGMGAPASAIDFASFTAAGATLFAEGFGLSMMWTKQSTIEAFVSEVLDHIEATLFVSPLTGLLTLKLIRNDYDVEDLAEFTPDNSVVTNWQRKLWGETVNEIVVSWTNPANEETETVVAQDNANIAAQGGIVSDGRNYYGVRVKDLAMRLAQRDLRAASTPLASCDIEVNREAWSLLPGDVVILNSPEDDINSIVMRVGPVDYGKPGDPTVKASLVEDVWALPLAEYTVPPDTLHDDGAEEPSAADNTLIFTLPYFVTVNKIDSATLSGVEYPEVFAGVLASEDGLDTSEFELLGEVTDAGGNIDFANIGTKNIASRATLPGAIDAEVETTIVSFPDRTQGNGPRVGGIMLIEGDDETEHELCLVTAWGGSPTAYTFLRGALDTVPRAWPAGTPVWFFDQGMAFTDATIRSEAETVDYKVLIRTSLGLLAEADAPTSTETLTGRPHLPLRPADVTVDGDDGFSGVVDLNGVDPIPTAWARRNRLTEDAVVLAWDAADVTPEVGQTTTVRLTDLAGATLHEYTGIAGTSQNVSPADFGAETEGYIEFVAVRDSLESLMGHRVRVLVAGSLFEFEDGSAYEFEDDEPKIFED